MTFHTLRITVSLHVWSVFVISGINLDDHCHLRSIGSLWPSIPFVFLVILEFSHSSVSWFVPWTLIVLYIHYFLYHFLSIRFYCSLTREPDMDNGQCRGYGTTLLGISICMFLEPPDLLAPAEWSDDVTLWDVCLLPAFRRPPMPHQSIQPPTTALW